MSTLALVTLCEMSNDTYKINPICVTSPYVAKASAGTVAITCGFQRNFTVSFCWCKLTLTEMELTKQCQQKEGLNFHLPIEF